MFPSHIMRAAKDELRRRMRDRRLMLTAAELVTSGIRAAAQFETIPGVADTRLVTVYSSFRGEIDTAPLVARLRARGVRVAYPRVVPDERRLEFHLVANESQLVRGTLGIPEPPVDLPLVDPADIGIFVVPGLAFDESGGRLGWGRGHYDNTLAAAPWALRVGYTHSFQVVSSVPAGAGDERMDWLVTESEARPTRSRPSIPLRRVR
jgi:5-formyltetrahydrofolate cyclo-ligase